MSKEECKRAMEIREKYQGVFGKSNEIPYNRLLQSKYGNLTNLMEICLKEGKSIQELEPNISKIRT